jgi:hypothetical protein
MKRQYESQVNKLQNENETLKSRTSNQDQQRQQNAIALKHQNHEIEKLKEQSLKYESKIDQLRSWCRRYKKRLDEYDDCCAELGMNSEFYALMTDNGVLEEKNEENNENNKASMAAWEEGTLLRSIQRLKRDFAGTFNSQLLW